MRRARFYFEVLQRTFLVRVELSRHSGLLATIKFTKNNRIQAVSHSPILALTGTTIEALFILKTLVESFLILCC
jgi:hypothetical protein